MGCRSGNKEKILECARQLFYHLGYHSTSVDEILKECGVAKSNFYYHFESKEQLALEVLERQMAAHETLLLESLRNESLPPMERLRTFLARTSQIQTELSEMGGCPFGNLAASLPSTGSDSCTEKFRERLRTCFQAIQSAMRDCLAEGMAEGVFRDDVNPDRLASLMVAGVQGLLIMTKTHRDAASLTQGADVMMKLITFYKSPV